MTYVPINIKPHLPHPGQTWGIKPPLALHGLVSPGVSLQCSLKELMHKLQYAALLSCITQYSTKILLVARPEVWGKQLRTKSVYPHTSPGCGRWGITLIGALCYYNVKDLHKNDRGHGKIPTLLFFWGEPCMCATPIFHPNKKICIYVTESMQFCGIVLNVEIYFGKLE